MSKRLKIVFMAPETKWGPYYIYKDISEYLQQKYPNYEIKFLNSKKDYLKLQLWLFWKIDYLFSIIPFLFRPRNVKNYIFNPSWNWEIEKLKKWLWNKLLYFAERNLDFADKIWLTSYFLADKLWFREKYEDKIVIIPNFVDLSNKSLNIRKNYNNPINILTVSSTKFLQKWMWIVDLWYELSKIADKQIKWTIIAWWNKNNKKIIKEEFSKIDFPNNLKIEWLDWIDRQELENYYQQADIFIYGTRLDTWWQTIMEAMSFGLPVILFEYELWKYIYPEEIITDNVKNKLEDILGNYEDYSKKSINFVKQFDRDKVLSRLNKIIDE